MPDRSDSGDYSRRQAIRLIATAQAAVVVGGAALASERQPEPGPEKKEAEAPPPKPSPYAKFIAKDEAGLSGEERALLRKQMPGLEGALKKLRDFNLADDVEPAISFRALASGPRSRP